MNIQELKESCTGCTACCNACPAQAISMQENTEGFAYPVIDPNMCTECGLCESICPEPNNPFDYITAGIKQAFYGWHTADSVRLSSSSGGVFTALAECLMKRNGIVYGAVYDRSSRKVCHASTLTVCLDALRQSKYVQSSLGKTFAHIKMHLKEGRAVMFVGTPCQASGLRAYLGKDYDSLLICDFICHGVPPMKMLNDHITEIEKKHQSSHVSISFRKKFDGWTRHYFACELEHKEVVRLARFDPFFNGFNTNLNLRSSCYQCRYASRQHVSDITLADFWGYRFYNPEIYDDKGISLVLANSQTGLGFLEKISPADLTLHAMEWTYAEYAFRERSSDSYDPERRNAFFKTYVNEGYSIAVRKFRLKGRWAARIKYFAQNLIRTGRMDVFTGSTN